MKISLHVIRLSTIKFNVIWIRSSITFKFSNTGFPQHLNNQFSGRYHENILILKDTILLHMLIRFFLKQKTI